MSVEYQSTEYQLYKLLQCPENIKIPINDQQAWLYYSKFRQIYNKQSLADFQNIYNAIMPIRPNRYPVILTSLNNLYADNQYFILNNDNDFFKKWGFNGFWTELLSNPYDSYDLILNNGNIIWHTCFRGHPASKIKHSVHNIFDYFEGLPDKKLPNIILQLVKHKLKHYTGCLNIECLNNKIVECHLRFEFLDKFEDKRILMEIINLFQNKSITLSSDYLVPKIYIFVIWGKKLINNHKIHNNIINILKKYQITTYQKYKYQTTTNKYKRLYQFTTINYDHGKIAKTNIINLLLKTGYVSM